MTQPHLGTVSPTALVDARVQLHWAAQVVAAAADGWLAKRADDSHTAMRWDRATMVGETGIGLRVVPELAIVSATGVLPLAGKRLADAMAWADRQLGAPRGIHARDYDMPAHPVATGAAFEADAAALGELARWYDAGADALGSVGVELRIWPHHFDLGGIVFLDAGSTTRQIGVGLSPGDVYYAEPYLYVTPYPIAEGTDFPPLPVGGFWRRESWTGAVLRGSTVLAAPVPRDAMHAFVAAAIAAARAVIA